MEDKEYHAKYYFQHKEKWKKYNKNRKKITPDKAKEYNDRYRKNHYKRSKENQIYNKRRKSMGICIFCGEMNWYFLEEHHPDPLKIPNFKVTLCANCHRKLHWLMGGTIMIRR